MKRFPAARWGLSFLLAFCAIPAARAEPHSVVIIQRFGSGVLDTGMLPQGTRQDCALLLLNVSDAVVKFGKQMRVDGQDPLKFMKGSDAAALDHMVASKTLSAEGRAFYTQTTRDLAPEQSTYVDYLEELEDGVTAKGEVHLEGKRYRRSAVLRTVSAQEIVGVAAGGSHVDRHRFHPLPWMEEYPEFWESHRARFAGMLMFEEGRGAAIQRNVYRTNRMLTAWFALRETLAYHPLEAIVKSDAFLGRTVIFGHTKVEKNTRKFLGSEYGFRSLGKPDPNAEDEIIYITLKDLLSRFPVERHFPFLADELARNPATNIFETLKRYGDGFGYRRQLLESSAGDVVEIQDRTVLGFHRFFPVGDPTREAAIRFCQQPSCNPSRKPLDYELEIAKEIPTFPDLEMPRLWWTSRRCGVAGAPPCGYREGLRGLFQTLDWMERQFAELARSGLSDAEMRQTKLFSISLSDVPDEVLAADGIPVFARGRNFKVVSLSYAEAVRLRAKFPEISALARRRALRVGPWEFKKRLLFPSFQAGIIP